MKRLLILVVFLSACFKPVSTSVGMSYDSFKDLCEVTDERLTDMMSNTSGSFFTIELKNTDARREKGLDMKGCIGKFTFRNSTLDTIHP